MLVPPLYFNIVEEMEMWKFIKAVQAFGGFLNLHFLVYALISQVSGAFIVGAAWVLSIAWSRRED